MDQHLPLLVDLGIILVLLAGIAQFRTPRGARRGNVTAAVALGLAALVVLTRNQVHQGGIVVAVLVAGSAAGWLVAARVTMIQIPAMVAFQHGAGGVAAFLVSFVELARCTSAGLDVAKASGLVGLVLGAATFSGSLVAGGKLAGRLKSNPLVLPGHGLVTLLLALAVVALAVFTGLGDPAAMTGGAIALIFLSVLLGLIFAVRIGGADMPVLISFLNATAGVAAAFCGVIIHNKLLVACGATVAASGSILTHVMCKAMNRSLLNVFLGFKPGKGAGWLPGVDATCAEVVGGETETPDRDVSSVPEKEDVSAGSDEEGAAVADDALAGSEEEVEAVAGALMTEAAKAAREARRVVFVPGYGMALAQAQFKVVELAGILEARGTEVQFAIHPVAGRMPGHMNVLLAEADASYEQLLEMDDVNPTMGDVDLAIVVGACDVVNPAAVEQEGTSISGMPILNVHEARQVAVFNLDDRPGYSGVENLLYSRPGVIMLLGDAKETITRFIEEISKLGELSREARSTSTNNR